MRHIIYRRILACLCVLLVFSQIVQVALEEHNRAQAAEQVLEEQEKLTLWYTDEKLNLYLVNAASQFEQETGVEVTLQLVTAVDYIELINRASISEGGGPDLFVTSSELLEKARLAGLTVENDSFREQELEGFFPQKALEAATCGGKLVAYPFYFETCFLLYNRNYVDHAPASIDEILAYSDTFEATERMANVENILKWNVADIFYNFFFIANYVNLGGPTGDDPSQVQLTADEVYQCLEYYQSLNAFFAIDAEAVTTDDVLQEFIEGKTIYTIAKTDAIKRLDEAIAQGQVPQLPPEEGEMEAADQGEEAEGTEGEESQEPVEELPPEEQEAFYGIAMVPDLTGELHTKGLSVTNSVVVNAYSKCRERAKEFAKYITYNKVDSLYMEANKMPVKIGVPYENKQMQVLIDQYEESVEVPKITDLSNYWIWMEITFANIWKGGDVQEEIQSVAGKVEAQLTQ
ncbi:MAG: extracellular solute-binding protein [Lachnospiraceae bacterium]|nr:extracellular solute-binding protein [Lachnospiraceae bacterium]